MDAYTAITQRRTAHQYLAEPVPQAAILRGLEAANTAPCHKLTFPWKFYLLGHQFRAAFLEIVMAHKARGGTLTDAQKASISENINNPGILMLVTCARSDDAFRQKEDYAATCCALQNFFVAMSEQGYATKWGTGSPTRDPKTYQLAQIDESKEEIIGLIYGGVPKIMPPAIQRPMLEHIFKQLD